MFRRWRAASAVLAATAFLTAACTGTVNPSSTGSGGGSSSGNQPHRGGTLTMLGQSDIFNLDTVSAYYTVSSMLERMFTRQLFSYGDPNGVGQRRRRWCPTSPPSSRPRPTAASAMAARRITLHIRPGVKWDTTPARQVTAADFVREFKMLCNPASPVGAPGYFTNTIVGMASYCTGFAKVPATVAGIASYENSHSLPGVVATELLHADLPPAQPDAGLPVHPDHGLLLGPPGRVHEVRARQRRSSASTRSLTARTQITSYVAGKSFTLARNPAWSAATDPNRHAYVNKITITEGLTQDSVQQQLVAGTGRHGMGRHPARPGPARRWSPARTPTWSSARRRPALRRPRCGPTSRSTSTPGR